LWKVLSFLNIFKDYFTTQNTGQAPLSFGVQIVKGVPIALDYVGEIEFYAALGKTQSCRGPLIIISAMKKIHLKPLFCHFVRQQIVKVRQLADGSCVT